MPKRGSKLKGKSKQWVDGSKVKGRVLGNPSQVVTHPRFGGGFNLEIEMKDRYLIALAVVGMLSIPVLGWLLGELTSWYVFGLCHIC